MDLTLHLLGRDFLIRCGCERAAAVLDANFSALRAIPSARPFAVYRIVAHHHGWQLNHDGQPSEAQGPGDLLYVVERQLVLDLQAARPDLLFVHAAALADARGAVVLVAPSGTGKSTAALALAERGWRYLSDELAPMEPTRARVHPYPHALCLKHTLPPHLADAGFQTEVTAHVRAERLNPQIKPLPLRALVFLQRGRRRGPRITPLSQAQAVARLFPEILNGLAHPPYGLDAALLVTAGRPALLLDLGEVERSVDLLEAALAGLAREHVA